MFTVSVVCCCWQDGGCQSTNPELLMRVRAAYENRLRELRDELDQLEDSASACSRQHSSVNKNSTLSEKRLDVLLRQLNHLKMANVSDLYCHLRACSISKLGSKSWRLKTAPKSHHHHHHHHHVHVADEGRVASFLHRDHDGSPWEQGNSLPNRIFERPGRRLQSWLGKRPRYAAHKQQHKGKVSGQYHFGRYVGIWDMPYWNAVMAFMWFLLCPDTPEQQCLAISHDSPAMSQLMFRWCWARSEAILSTDFTFVLLFVRSNRWENMSVHVLVDRQISDCLSLKPSNFASVVLRCRHQPVRHFSAKRIAGAGPCSFEC